MEEPRPGERAVELPAAEDAGVIYIGRIHTPYATRLEAPRQGSPDGPVCRIEIFAPWVPALAGLEAYEFVQVLYWLHLSRRDLITQSPRGGGAVTGTFSLRSPVRPNPIGTVMARFVRIDGPNLMVRGLDCVDGTPLLDLKPERCGFTPLAPPRTAA